MPVISSAKADDEQSRFCSGKDLIVGTGTHPVPPLARGAFVARVVAGAGDIVAAQSLRHLCFVEAAGRVPMADGLDQDRFDTQCDHVLIEGTDGRLVGCYRVQFFATPQDLRKSYSAQFYNLDGLSGVAGGFLELGRFCVAPDMTDPDVLRIAWGMLARLVDQFGATMLFGCSSFAGTNPDVYREAFGLLGRTHAVAHIGVQAPETVTFATDTDDTAHHGVALGQIPPLLRTYLSMGGWVGDHAVIDREMNTLHVFTGLEIAAIPAARARALRAVGTKG